MNPNRDTSAFTRNAGMRKIGRTVLCACIASAVTMVLWGEVGRSAAQAAQRAEAEQSANDRTVVIDEEVVARPVVRKPALI